MKHNFSRYIEDMDPAKYQETVYKNIHNHLRLMNMVLEASQATLKASPITRDKLVDDNTYTSTLNKKAIEEILKTVSYMIPTEKSQWNHLLYPIVGLAGLALLSSLIFLRKIF